MEYEREYLVYPSNSLGSDAWPAAAFRLRHGLGNVCSGGGWAIRNGLKDWYLISKSVAEILIGTVQVEGMIACAQAGEQAAASPDQRVVLPPAFIDASDAEAHARELQKKDGAAYWIVKDGLGEFGNMRVVRAATGDTLPSEPLVIYQYLAPARPSSTPQPVEPEVAQEPPATITAEEARERWGWGPGKPLREGSQIAAVEAMWHGTIGGKPITADCQEEATRAVLAEADHLIARAEAGV